MASRATGTLPPGDAPSDRGAALVAVAHGSRDPRSAETIARLAEEVRRQSRTHTACGRAPGLSLDVRVAFLDLSAPRLPEVLAGVAADGHRGAVVVPLLLGSAFHARVDVPGAVSEAARRHPRLEIAVSDVLGDDPGVDAAALDRLHTALATRTAGHLAPAPEFAGVHPTSQDLHDLRGAGNPCEVVPGCPTGERVPPGCSACAAEFAGVCPTSRAVYGLRGAGNPCEVGPGCPLTDPELGVVLASVGSTRAAANLAVEARVQRWRERFGWAAASAAYVTAAEPTPAQAIDAVRAAGARRVAVVPWVLAPGRLPDRIEAAADEAGAVLARPIGPHPDLAAAVLRRWAENVIPAGDVRQVG